MSEQIVAGKLPAVIASRYVPIREIGRGGMGMVYEVEHIRTGERLALKVLLSTVGSSPDALERFKREARASARIKSENVVRVTDADVAIELDGAPFLVMELLEGTDIEKAANDSHPTPATVVEWLRQVARAIDKAHRLGIVHRDLKPENLFLATVEDRSPIVKILDFGIAKMAQDGATATGSGQVLGTPKYMAPEQVAGNPRVSPATDRYALGLVGYRLIMGESYYPDDNVMSILGQLLHGQLQPPSARGSQFGVAFDDWFKKACHREPEGRFASAAAQIEALADALGLPSVPIEISHERSTPGRLAPGGTTPTQSSTLGVSRVPPRPLLSGGRRRMKGLAAASLVTVMIAALAWLTYRGSKADHSRGERGAATAPSSAPPQVVIPRSTTATVMADTDRPRSAKPDQSRASGGESNIVESPPPGVPVEAHGTRKKSPPLMQAIRSGAGADRQSAPADDPFRDQK